MKVRDSILFLILIVFAFNNLRSQPTDIFDGGVGIGYSSIELISNIDHLYSGGINMGYNIGSVVGVQDYVFLGGGSDGYSSDLNSNETNMLYSGEADDGYAISTNRTGNEYLYLGGVDDGYVLSSYKAPFIWTGNVGTGWLVSSNWNYNIVPDIKRPVIIPEGVPNFPYVNAGIFSIGDNPNLASFVCESLWIQENALLVTRASNRVENYNFILIDGEMQVKKTTSDAIENYAEGTIEISPTGTLKIKP